MLAVAIFAGGGGGEITTKLQFNTTEIGKIPQPCLYLVSPYLVWMSMCIYFYIYREGETYMYIHAYRMGLMVKLLKIYVIYM